MSLVARDLMEQNVLTIPASMPFREVQHLLVEAGCHGAPVVDDAGTVIGIVTAMDLLRAADQAYDEDLDPGEAVEPGVAALTAMELASPELVWVGADTPVADVARLMHDQAVHRVLVGTGGTIAGLISAFDLVRAVGR